MPDKQDFITRNVPTIKHGGKERNGASYVSAKGFPLSASVHLDQINIYHYGWYCLPRRWEMKQTHHYYEGRRNGIYESLDDYVHNLDDEPTNFWDIPWQSTIDHYIGAIIAEMKHPSVKRYRGKHPEIMREWMERQNERILKCRRGLIRRLLDRIM